MAAKRNLLSAANIDFDAVPPWQRRGTGFWFEEHDREEINPVTGATKTARRRRLVCQPDLPVGGAYDDLILSLLHSA